MTAPLPISLRGAQAYGGRVFARQVWRRLAACVRAWATEPDDGDATREMLDAAREALETPVAHEGETPRYAFELWAEAAKRVASGLTPAPLRPAWAPVLVALADLVDGYLTEQQDRDARVWRPLVDSEDED